LGFFTEGYEVGRVSEVLGVSVWWSRGGWKSIGAYPVIVCPKLASGTNTCLDLVDNQQYVVLAGDLTNAAEEGWTGVVVTTFRLNWFYDDSGNWVREFDDEFLHFLQAAALFGCVLVGVLIERIPEVWEWSLRPIER